MRTVQLLVLGGIAAYIAMLPRYSFAKNIAVLAVDYPPFTSPSSVNNGVAFSLLQQKTTDDTVTWTPAFAPPARISQLIRENKWCASFYPVNKDIASEKIKLSNGLVTIGLVRAKPDAGDFEWTHLSDLAGHSVALLRTSHESEFFKQFIDAGLNVIEVESVKAGVDMVLRGRVDFSLADNISANLNPELQFSRTALERTNITLFVNPNCDFPKWYKS